MKVLAHTSTYGATAQLLCAARVNLLNHKSMNIPKPAIVVGLVALIGAYVASQSASNQSNPAQSSTHTHADGTVHEGSEHGGESSGSQAADAPSSEASPSAASMGSGSSPVANATKLQITDVKKGTGATAADGKNLTMHYRGTLTNGKEFDASYNRGEPFIFTLGKGEVIRGWDQGIKGMKVGGKRRLVIPGDLAYGPNGTPDGSIPPNATLVFEVELLNVT